jgi:glycosyltransferase involved in cell wall biosynthesis
MSVIVATYEVADVVRDALDSIRSQTLQPAEVIVCDDGSTDDIEGALRPYRDDVVFFRKPHAGEASAKNAAAAAATAELVVILDADDVFLPTRLEALADASATRTDLDILTTDAFLEVDGHVVRRCYEAGWRFEIDNQRHELLRRNFVFGLAAVRRELLLQAGGFDETILWTTDWECWIRLVLDGARIGCVDEPLALYRLRERSLSAQRASMLRGKIATLEKTRLDARLERDDREVLERALSGYRRDLAVSELERGLQTSPGAARREAAALALGRGFDLGTRVRAVAAAIAPAATSRRLRERDRTTWVGAGGIRIDRRPNDCPLVRVVVYTDSGEIGGAERSLENLVAAFSPAVAVTVLGTDRAVVEMIAAARQNSDTVVVPFVRSRSDLPALLAHAHALLRLRPDVFHANLVSPWACQAAIYLALFLPRTRVVAVEQLPTSPFAPTRSQRWLKRLASKLIDAHVAVGERSSRDIETALGLREGAVRTIHNGVADRAVPARRPQPPTNQTIGSIGRFERQKGYDVLLYALRDLPAAKLVLVGDGVERPHLERLACELAVSERVVWTGWVTDPHEHLAAMDVFVLPSRFEGFPLAVVEAMLAELPVVATTVGSIDDAVVDGETGLLVPPDDSDALATAIGKLLADGERRRRMGLRGRERALERFTSRATAAAFEALYTEIRS